jgi:hypothetical protein
MTFQQTTFYSFLYHQQAQLSPKATCSCVEPCLQCCLFPIYLVCYCLLLYEIFITSEICYHNGDNIHSIYTFIVHRLSANQRPDVDEFSLMFSVGTYCRHKKNRTKTLTTTSFNMILISNLSTIHHPPSIIPQSK